MPKMKNPVSVRKLPSGHYQIRKMQDGETYTKTVDYKPTQLEALAIIQSEIERVTGETEYDKKRFMELANEYLELKQELSPATLRSYDIMIRHLPEWFAKLRLNQITEYNCQKLCNDYAKDHSPKSTHNLWGFIRAVLNKFDKTLTKEWDITLPRIQQKEPAIPSDDDVKKLMEYLKEHNTKYYCAYTCLALGIRRGELCALDISDLHDNNTVFIHRSKVRNKEREWVIKECPKTDKSNRYVRLPDDVADMIREEGHFYNGSISNLRNYLAKVCKRLDIPVFYPHLFRHYFASVLHDEGFSDKQIQDAGGWSTNHVMRTVYTHSRSMDEARNKITDTMSSKWS